MDTGLVGTVFFGQRNWAGLVAWGYSWDEDRPYRPPRRDSHPFHRDRIGLVDTPKPAYQHRKSPEYRDASADIPPIEIPPEEPYGPYSLAIRAVEELLYQESWS